MIFTKCLSYRVEALEFGSHPPCGVGVIIILWPKELGFRGGERKWTGSGVPRPGIVLGPAPAGPAMPASSDLYSFITHCFPALNSNS